MGTFTPTRHRTRRNQRQLLLVNASKARREVVNGREFLVCPMALIVPGVLNGSRGALLYPPSEVAKEPGLWNGVPICDGHPTENGSHVSGRTPSTMASHWLGHVFNDRWDGSKRAAEGWFDVEATKRVNPAIYNRLQKGESIELSTGLFTDNHDRKGTWNGKPYDAIAYNYRPDHLAILHSQKGACSREDGCGVMVNSGNRRLLANDKDALGHGSYKRGEEPDALGVGGKPRSPEQMEDWNRKVASAQIEGLKAHLAGKTRSHNPHPVGSNEHSAWEMGRSHVADLESLATAGKPYSKDWAKSLNSEQGRDDEGQFAPGTGAKDKSKDKQGKNVELPKAAKAGSTEAEARIAKQNAFFPKTRNQNTDQSGPECKCKGACGKCGEAQAFAPKSTERVTNQRSFLHGR